VQISPIPKERLSEIYPKNYYSFVAGNKSIAFRLKEILDRRFFAKLLSRITKPTIRVLDVGGGTGWLLDLIRSADARVSDTQVVDIDEHAGSVAREHGHSYFHGTIESFRSDAPFDLALLLNLIEHVEDPRAVLASVKNILSGDGRIVIKTPNYDSLDARLFRGMNWGGLHCPRHWHLFTRESFEKLAASVGLRIEEFRYTQGAPFWAVSVMGWLAGRGVVRITPQTPIAHHPMYTLLLTLFAVVDVLRGPFSQTSQMFIILKK
jgi:2-polyprenyl-3-methyl-5-hydroxy-6-metoxy-1,4-benzoquinol methylase